MAELNPNIPLDFLSGKYTQNYWKDQPLSTMMDTYLNARKNQQLFDEIERKKQAYKNVAQARKGVESKYNETAFNKAKAKQTGDLNSQVIAKQSELDAIDAQIKTINDEIARNNQRVGSMNSMADYNQESEDARKLMSGYTEQPTRNPINTLTGEI